MLERLFPRRIQGPFFTHRPDWERLYDTRDPFGSAGRWLLERRRQDYMRRLFQKWGPYDRALDLGSGEGVFTKLLSEYCDSLISVEIAEQALRRQKDLLAGDRRLFVHADAFRMAFRERSFDLVCANLVMAYSTDRQRVVEEWVRWLRPGGLMFVVETLLPGYFNYEELLRLISRVVEVQHVEALSSKLLMAKISNRKLVPFHERVYDWAMERTRVRPSTRAKHVCIIGQKRA